MNSKVVEACVQACLSTGHWTKEAISEWGRVREDVLPPDTYGRSVMQVGKFLTILSPRRRLSAWAALLLLLTSTWNWNQASNASPIDTPESWRMHVDLVISAPQQRPRGNGLSTLDGIDRLGQNRASTSIERYISSQARPANKV